MAAEDIVHGEGLDLAGKVVQDSGRRICEVAEFHALDSQCKHLNQKYNDILANNDRKSLAPSTG